MSEIPAERMVASTVFANVGVDYFGPFLSKISRRTEQLWCCLFTFLTVRAVHIEIVPKLDTNSCLNAIMWFIARRDKPIKMIVDDETKLVGADREFEEYENHLVHQGIRWKFNPHVALHFGGVGEQLVQERMYAVLGNRSITEDVFSTTICLVEQTLNARPLTQVSSDVNDL